MLELLDKEYLGKLRPDTVSFLIKFAITDISQLNVDDLTKRLSDKELCFENNCYFELDINYDKESEVMLSVIVFLPASKWPEDPWNQEKVIDKYATNISIIYEKIIEKEYK
jgi:hypothetical protein